jgi:hypothetical protein
MVDRPRNEVSRGPLKFGADPPPKAHRCRLAERDSDHVFEHGTIPVPANPGTGIISDQEDLHEIIRLQAGEVRGALS